ncbi:prolyl 3-hydroxylase OGFOD1 [Polypterus senegalus]|uniref:prolyl 3-hydroxylase OGFOD1 n=1 Tax=Polypterus senegalus TaxID=55291 RepID=UPI00196495F7|nr:prolyl 3-hydroxylase OGFOD1 [Polypterus senegalus]
MSSKRRNVESVNHSLRKKDKRCDSVGVVDVIREEAVKAGVKEAWRSKTKFSRAEAIEVDSHPFPHCIIQNFIENSSFLESLKKELLDLSFHEKSNDLYKFKQSDDLKKSQKPHISALRKVLFEEFRLWLSEVLEVDLRSTVDLSCAKYENSDVLLCHDDELEGRRIAFILYLVPPWEQSDGGILDLFDTDNHLQPRKILKSLVPSWNTLVFFEVSPVSFHQVSEVTSEGKCRLSVGGWFHGSSVERPPRYIEPVLPRNPHLQRDESLLNTWINAQYLDMSFQAQVQEEFEETSEILLKDFLQPEQYKMVSEALKESKIRWNQIGPPNKRCYSQADEASLPECVRQCWELLASEAFFLLLSNFTGLKLHFLAPSGGGDDDDDNDDEEEEEEKGGKGEKTGEVDVCETINAGPSLKEPSTPGCRGELQRWQHGNYTLIHDTDPGNTEFALDLLLYFNCEEWKTTFGGFTSYIARDEDEELLTVYPESNSLALIYRDKETLKFVKHINNHSVDHQKTTENVRDFYDFSFVYYE